MLDQYIWGDVSRISPEAPVPIVRVNHKTNVPGGAANVATNVAKLEGNAMLIGIKGDDAQGAQLENLLEKNNIHSNLVIANDRPTTTKTRIMSQGQQLVRIDEEIVQPISEETEAHIVNNIEELLENCSVVILSDYGKGILTKQICKKAIDGAQKKGIPCIVDPKGKRWGKYQGASCITPNVKEFEGIVGLEDLNEEELIVNAFNLCSELHLDYLLVTRGPDGMMLVESRGKKHLFVPSEAKEVFDVSGAGDTAIATLAMGLASGLPWAESTKIANLAAGIVVGKLGTRPVTLEELKQSFYSSALNKNARYYIIQNAKEIIGQWRQQGQSIVFTNGCFDLLHAGHIKLIETASRYGDRLVIGLNSDESVRKIKGDGRPILNQHERATLLSALSEVDLIILFDEETPVKLLEEIRPDVLVKGNDYSIDQVVGKDLVEQYGGRVVLIDLEPGISTTEILGRIHDHSN